MLLIYPPVAKPAEAPAGLAQLSGVFKSTSHKLIDANIEGLCYLLNKQYPPENARHKMALHNLHKNLESIQNIKTYLPIHHYNRIVKDLSRILQYHGLKYNTRLGLSSFKHTHLTPAKSTDLLYSAEHPEENVFYPYFREKIILEIEKQQPETVCISIIYLDQALTAFALIGTIKKTMPWIKIIIGGGLVTSWMSQPTWNNPFHGLIDHIVSGPGEQFLRDYCHISESPTHVTPDYSQLKNINYFSPGFILPYSTSTGCYWKKCTFCPETTEQNPYKPKDNKKIIQDLIKFKELKPVLLHFLDNALSPNFLEFLINADIKIPWYGYVRFTEKLLERDFCFKLAQSGCVMLQLGLESGSQTVLDRLQKGINLEQVTIILKNLKNAGIGTYVYFLFGTPYESYDEAQKTLHFIQNHFEYIDFMNPALFNLPKFSKDVEFLKTRSFYDGDLSLYLDFKNPSGWHRKDTRHFLDREFKRDKYVAEILRRTPATFTSDHAPFFIMNNFNKEKQRTHFVQYE